ncbi:MAG: oxidoreductase [Rhodobacteraceae bacterium]|jgi:predicted oxidoreductase|nr:oxidoreductase [Paracoccaceae bacterium]NCZ65082.1 oxidoreductase [Paracoccaceae bacterium]NDD32373.1 oxidoreductase [Paracoccaceae bacterium]NDD88338.1 oxidoreductase [Paracoccaceae bacterium]NDH20326.1 oxidoreductase [Paracoccaceae bacterium]
MERISLNKEVSLSRIVYGMWRLGDDKNTSPNHVRAKIDASLDQGITSFDQADIYGGYEAEEILGNALSGSTLRNKMEIVTKCDIIAPVGRYADARVKYYDTSRAHILASVDHSLRLMGIDHIDLLLIHRPDPLMDHHETGAALDEVIASGKVRSVGVSNFRHYDWELLQSAMKNQLVTNQIELSVLAHDSFVNGDVAFHQRIGTPLMAWSPLAGGALFSGDHPDIMSALSNVALQNNVDETAVAIAWLLAHPSRILPVLGTNSLDRIKGMSAALDVKMDRQTWYEIYTAALGREVA